MKAMILAAGEGRRMRPLTLTTPKPLLPVKDKPLIVHHIERLRSAGISNIVINVAYLGEKIQAYLGCGDTLGVNIEYSVEPEPLETAGALLHAMPLLGGEPFILLNGDVWTDYPLDALVHNTLTVVVQEEPQLPQRQSSQQQSPQQPFPLQQPPQQPLGHLILVPNPPFKNKGDFFFNEQGLITQMGCGYTFSGISKIHPGLIQSYPFPKTKLPLRDVFAWAIEQQMLTAEMHQGMWMDIGTPERLAQVNAL